MVERNREAILKSIQSKIQQLGELSETQSSNTSLLGCPFCGHDPVRDNHWGGYVKCGNEFEDCPLSGDDANWISEQGWQKRVNTDSGQTKNIDTQPQDKK